MGEQTQLQQPRLHPWHLETSDLCISWADLVLSRPICTEVTAVRKELSQHNQRSSCIRRNCSKKCQAPNSDKVAQSFGQWDFWNPPDSNPLFHCLTYIIGKWFSKHPNWTIPASLQTHCFFALTMQSWKKSGSDFSAIFSQALEGCSWYSKPSHLQRDQLSSASLSSEAPCYEMCWVTPIPYAQLSTATQQPGLSPIIAAMSPCPSSSRDSSKLRICDRWLWRALEATQIRRYNVTLELLHNINPIYRGVSGSFLPA